MSNGIIFLLILAALVAAFGQLMFKYGADTGGGIMAILLNPYTMTGLASYFLSMILWLKALTAAPLHVVYPFTLLTFVLVGLASVAILGERPTSMSLIGWGVICAGIGVVYLGAR